MYYLDVLIIFSIGQFYISHLLSLPGLRALCFKVAFLSTIVAGMIPPPCSHLIDVHSIGVPQLWGIRIVRTRVITTRSSLSWILLPSRALLICVLRPKASPSELLQFPLLSFDFYGGNLPTVKSFWSVFSIVDAL